MSDIDRAADFLAAVLVEGRERGSLPDRICRVCARLVAVTGASISVETAVGRETVGSTDALASRIEELQFTMGEGPCVQAATTSRPVLTADLSDVTGVEWPIFAAAAVEAGAGAVFALPLQIGAVVLGILDLYRLEPGPLEGDDLSTALVIADTAALLLATAMTDDSGDEPDAGWLAPPSGLERAEVHQATGMISVQLGVSLEEALVRLRAFAFAHGHRLGDLASDVVAHRLRFDTT